MPRYTAKCYVDQTTNGDTARQFVEVMADVYNQKVTVISCPVYFTGRKYRQFEFESDNPHLAVIPYDKYVFNVVRLWDKDDTGKDYLAGCAGRDV